MKQTAVEWLLDNLLSEPWTEEHFKYNAECWEKAKEMERQQIMTAFTRGDIFGADYFDGVNITEENYYNQTFKQQEQ
jgi:hypothetical protein